MRNAWRKVSKDRLWISWAISKLRKTCLSPSAHCNCRVRRFITILFYLRDVEEGGETAFPVADNSTISLKVRRLNTASD